MLVAFGIYHGQAIIGIRILGMGGLGLVWPLFFHGAANLDQRARLKMTFIFLVV